jgi:hypothetical protein
VDSKPRCKLPHTNLATARNWSRTGENTTFQGPIEAAQKTRMDSPESRRIQAPCGVFLNEKGETRTFNDQPFCRGHSTKLRCEQIFRTKSSSRDWTRRPA